MDVGGGLGHHLEAVLKAVPGAQGVLFEHSAAVALAEERSWADSVAERVGGRERTRDEFTGLLADAGWSVSGIREDPRTRGSLIDCHPAA